MTVALEIVSWTLLWAGAFFVVVGGIGVIRLPDFFTRGHAAGITDTMGAGLILAGLMVEAGWSLNLGRLAIILFFLLFTSPTSSHALAHAALLGGVKPWLRRDDHKAQASVAAIDIVSHSKEPGSSHS